MEAEQYEVMFQREDAHWWYAGMRDAALGYRFPWRGDGEPTLIKGSLCDRWSNRPIAEITDDELAAVIQEAQDRAIPGWGNKVKDKKSA